MREIRIQHAVALLAKPGARIKFVAYAVGYKYVGEFDRDFKKLYGMSPRNYIRQVLNIAGLSQKI
jgi:AraC-like DNA-binding protein